MNKAPAPSKMDNTPINVAHLVPQIVTVRDCMRYAVSRFNASGISFGHGTDNAWDEAAYLVCHALSFPHEQLDVFLDARLLDSEREQTLRLIETRCQRRVPAAYLTHEAWLTGHRFYVDERVIVPRSFIAELLEDGLSPWVTDPDAVESALDLCTGSACLAILTALTFPQARVDAIDLSPDALAVARRNVADYGLEDRLRLVESNLFAGVKGRKYDVILSNPPYVDATAMNSLPAEYRAEPEMALAAGDDGLDIVRIILRKARRHLNPGGVLIVEIGHNRDVLEAAYPDLPFTWLETASGNEFVFLLNAEDLPA